jgi:hypothetical protein
METVTTSETSVELYDTTRRNIPKDNLLHTRRREIPVHTEKIILKCEFLQCVLSEVIVDCRT